MLKRALLTWIITAITVLSFQSAYADKVVLKSGREVEGTIIGKDKPYVKIDTGEKVLMYNLKDVVSIEGEGYTFYPEESQE